MSMNGTGSSSSSSTGSSSLYSTTPVSVTVSVSGSSSAGGGSSVVYELTERHHHPSSDGAAPPAASSPADSPSHTWAYILAILATLVALGALTALVVYFLKRSKLNKLRHHLMPLYTFDPAEEGVDWEAELLEDGLYHHIPPYTNMTTREVNEHVQQSPGGAGAAAAGTMAVQSNNLKLAFAGTGPTDYNSTNNT